MTRDWLVDQVDQVDQVLHVGCPFAWCCPHLLGIIAPGCSGFVRDLFIQLSQALGKRSHFVPLVGHTMPAQTYWGVVPCPPEDDLPGLKLASLLCLVKGGGGHVVPHARLSLYPWQKLPATGTVQPFYLTH